MKLEDKLAGQGSHLAPPQASLASFRGKLAMNDGRCGLIMQIDSNWICPDGRILENPGNLLLQVRIIGDGLRRMLGIVTDGWKY